MGIGKVLHFGTNTARSLDGRCLRISLHRKLCAMPLVEFSLEALPPPVSWFPPKEIRQLVSNATWC